MFVFLEDGYGEVKVEYPPRSPDLITSDFSLWCILKKDVHATKPKTLHALRREIEITCATVPLATIQNVCQSVALH
jgi:hypothetical protein